MDLQKQLEEVFTSDAYKKVTEAIKTDYILSSALLDEHNQPREEDWMLVKEPITLNGTPWRILIFKHVTATDALGSPTLLTFVRIEPPDGIKLALGTLAKEDPAWQKAVKDYSEAVASEDMQKTKGDLMQVFENKMYPGKEFHFTPDPQCYGLLPHFDYDFVIPFIGLPSLIQNAKSGN